MYLYTILLPVPSMFPKGGVPPPLGTQSVLGADSIAQKPEYCIINVTLGVVKAFPYFYCSG